MTALYPRAAAVGAASLHEAGGRIGALASAIKPLSPAQKLAAPAFTVRSPAGDNLWLHHAIYAAPKGSALVVACVGAGAAEFGYWGEVMGLAAMERGLAGLVITGGVRDAERLRAMAFPVFAGAICIRGTGKNIDGDGELGGAISIGDVAISAGDLIVGDADGVVCLPHARAGEIVERAEAREREEQEIFARLRASETTLDIYKLPAPRRLGEKP